ncbi:MAG: hypothetical protein AAF604_19845 [Acidobacteriota bacterium]
MPETSPQSPVSAVVWNWRHPAPPERSEHNLRREGIVRAVIGFAVAALIFLWKPVFGMVVAGITATLLLLALVAPNTAYRAVSHGLAVFAQWVAQAVTWILMTLLYYLMVTPAGFLLRVTGGSRITHGADAERTSYWETTEQAEASLDPYRRQF